MIALGSFLLCIGIAFTASWIFARNVSKNNIWWWHDRFSLLYLSVVLSLCVWSITYEQHLGFGSMTFVQQIVIVIVSAVFASDYGLLLGGVRVVRLDVLYVHHPLSLFGCGYQLWRGVGGGLMVHFLLDGLDGLVSSIGDVFQCSRVMGRFEKAASFVMRILWYPYVSVVALRWMYNHYSELDLAWQIMVVVWCGVANSIHLVMLVRHIQGKR